MSLGTMTWGEQNTQDEAFAQLDLAVERGVNFIDTAELYAVPPRPETYGATERMLGAWLKARGSHLRDDLVLATKVVGQSTRLSYIRGGNARLDAQHIKAALEASLTRLGLDDVDLYQLHWPDRHVNNFGELGYLPGDDREATPPEETLRVLEELIISGKVRHVGLSNETPWGVMTFQRLAENGGGPRMVSIQNPYSLLNRSFEVGLSEIAHREGIGLLAYSPLAMGMLTGKYRQGARPSGARLSVYPQFTRYTSERAERAVEAYAAVAAEAGVSLTALALAFVNQRPFVTSNILGATTLAQLNENLDAAETHLDADTLAAIDAVHREISNPCP